MSWKKNYWGVKKLDLFDTDDDGVPDIYDCDKNNPHRQGVIHDLLENRKFKKEAKEGAKTYVEKVETRDLSGLTPSQKQEFTDAVAKTFYAQKKLLRKLEDEEGRLKAPVTMRLPDVDERKAYKPHIGHAEEDYEDEYL